MYCTCQKYMDTWLLLLLTKYKFFVFTLALYSSKIRFNDPEFILYHNVKYYFDKFDEFKIYLCTLSINYCTLFRILMTFFLRTIFTSRLNNTINTRMFYVHNISNINKNLNNFKKKPYG